MELRPRPDAETQQAQDHFLNEGRNEQGANQKKFYNDLIHIADDRFAKCIAVWHQNGSANSILRAVGKLAAPVAIICMTAAVGILIWTTWCPCSAHVPRLGFGNMLAVRGRWECAHASPKCEHSFRLEFSVRPNKSPGSGNRGNVGPTLT